MDYVDEFGFNYGSRDSDLVKRKMQYDDWFEPKRIRRRRRFLKQWNKDRSSCLQRESAVLKKFCRKGLPDDYRSEVWSACLGLESERRKYGDAYYQGLLRLPVEKKSASVIEVDIGRTFPHNIHFKNGSGDWLPRLRRSLWAFAAHRKDVGYCQALNFICAVFLLVFDGDEERAFWGLSQMVSWLESEGYYSRGMVKVLADIDAVGVLLNKCCPRLPVWMQSVGIHSLSWVCTEWFHTLTATVLPFRAVLRVWDCIMTEGWKVLFRVAVGIFKIHEPQILQMDFETFMSSYRSLLKNDVDHNRLIVVSFRKLGTVRRVDLMAWRRTSLESRESELNGEADHVKELNNEEVLYICDLSPSALQDAPLT